MHGDLALVIAFILMIGMLAQWASWRLKLPAILLLLLAGIVLGPVSGLINPDLLFGDVLFPLVSLGVALVLFEGALTLRFTDIRGHGASVTSMVTWGAALNWLLIAAGIWLCVDLGWSMALLIGALLVVTGPTVVMPLLRTVKPNHNVSNILRWEGILIDPLGALLAVLVFEVIIAEGSDNFWVFLGHELLAGVLGGIVGGLLLVQLLRRHWLPEFLQSVFTMAFVLTVFTLANSVAEESGLLAVTVMGIWIGNSSGFDMEEILSFKENLTILIISMLFVVLAARIDIALLADLGWGAMGIILTVLVARFIMVFASTLHSDLRIQEKLFLGWIAPRGIVAAAVSALFAFRLSEIGYKDSELLPAIIFLIIIVTVLLQSLTAKYLANFLGVHSEENGVLIIGGNKVALAIAKALNSNGFSSLIVSMNWNEIQLAKMEGISTYYGNPVSSHADYHLDLLEVGKLLAMSHRPALNSLAAVKYRREFGRGNLFTLRTSEENDDSDKRRLTSELRVARLFGEEITSEKLAKLLNEGHQIKTTRFSKEYSLEDLEKNREGLVKLFAIAPNGKLHVYTSDSSLKLGKDWQLMYLSKID